VVEITMRSNAAFVVLLDLFILLFFSVAFFFLQARPDIVIELENPRDEWEAFFVVRKKDGIEEAYIGREWTLIGSQHAKRLDRAMVFGCPADLCAQYHSTGYSMRLFVGGDLGWKLGKLLATCAAAANCGKLKMRVYQGVVYCGTEACP
jgi:hypothetical protein